jgi:hypothetical protein
MNGKRDAAFACCASQFVEVFRRGRVEIGERRHTLNPGQRLHQDLLTLAVKLGGQDADACGIAARLGKRAHKSGPDHIVGKRENRDRRGRLLCSADGSISADQDHIDLSFD